jgi:hypothetical protein
MHWLMALLGFAVIVALAGEPCVAGANSELSSLRGTYWRLEHIDGATEETSNVVVRITGSSVDFSAPPCHFRCYPFDYRFRPGSLSVSGAFHQRSCLSRKWPVGGAVEANLHRINDYVLRGDDLSFLDGHGGPVMRLARIIADGLENRTWSIDQYWDGNSLVAPRVEAIVAFMSGGVDGSPGCGALEGQYKLSEAHLTAHVSWVLTGFCPPAHEPQNEYVAKALSGERLVEHDGDRIILRDEQGAVRVVLKPLIAPVGR